MSAKIKRAAGLFLCLMFFLPSCVREVDFSTAYQKKVVIYSVIHTYGGITRDTPGMRSDSSVYARYSDLQRLYMYYNSPNGKKEYLPEAKACLWDDETNELLAEFSRVSSEEWNTNYLPPYRKVDNDINDYSIHLRLEVDIPGEETIVARTSLTRHININSWQIHHNQSGQGNYYIQHDKLPAPVWFLPEALQFSTLHLPPGTLGGGGYIKYLKHIPVHILHSNYAYADMFNYYDGGFLYGLRVLPDNQEGDQRRYSMSMDGVQKEGFDYETHIRLTFVSEEYDRYLYDAIVYRRRHDNEADPLKHLYEDQIYSNINGGVGVFGAEVIVYLPKVVMDD